MNRLLVLAVAALALTACVGASAGPALPGVRRGLEVPAPEERRAAPDQRAALVSDEDDQLGVPDFAGKVLVVNFWASWCAPCRTEQPELNQAHEELAGDQVAFLGVDIQDTRPNARAHLREFDVPYPSLFDPANEYAARYGGVGPRTIPTTIVIDPQGRVAARLFGTTTAGELRALVTHLLGER